MLQRRQKGSTVTRRMANHLVQVCQQYLYCRFLKATIELASKTKKSDEGQYKPCSPDCPERRRVFGIPARVFAEGNNRLTVVFVGRAEINHGRKWCLSIDRCSRKVVAKSEARCDGGCGINGRGALNSGFGRGFG